MLERGNDPTEKDYRGTLEKAGQLPDLYRLEFVRRFQLLQRGLRLRWQQKQDIEASRNDAASANRQAIVGLLAFVAVVGGYSIYFSEWPMSGATAATILLLWMILSRMTISSATQRLAQAREKEQALHFQLLEVNSAAELTWASYQEFQTWQDKVTAGDDVGGAYKAAWFAWAAEATKVIYDDLKRVNDGKC